MGFDLQNSATDKQKLENIAYCRDLYSIAHWSSNYFVINNQGHVCVQAGRGKQQQLDLFRVVEDMRSQGMSLPILIRFSDILRDRVLSLLASFQRACLAHHYQGTYMPVYPIKVNQQRTVIEGILSTEKVGLEAGSKAELLAILGLNRQGIVICNGYKDKAYIRYALIGQQMGADLYIVIEKLSELELVLQQATELGVTPRLGVRIRLSSISSGKWQNSGGAKSKFGFNADNLLQFIEDIRDRNLLSTLQLMHFHMGSQVANIQDIKRALQEAARYYLQLRRCGANIAIVDAGGGLGIDYEGSVSRNDCSVNYSPDEYAENIIGSFAEICTAHQLPHPDIITESGRALTAHHAVLVTNVIEVETAADEELHGDLKPNPVESYHDAQFALAEAQTAFVQGQLSLESLADAEKRHGAICQRIKRLLNPKNHVHRELLHELEDKLADKAFCNFSVFQSLPDVWGLSQVFPIMPLNRLDERPTRRAVIQDLTCDSDGRIDRYVDTQNIENTLPIHEIQNDQEYLLGFFLVGAYQEILGDMHNLFGDTHSVNIEMDLNDYHVFSPLDGEHVSDLLDYVHINKEELKLSYRQKLCQSGIDDERQRQYAEELIAGLSAYTYMEK